MAAGKQSANFRANMMVPQSVSASTSLTHGDCYKAWTPTSGAGLITLTLPGAVPGAGPFYFAPIFNKVTIAIQSGDVIIGRTTGASLTADAGSWIGFYCNVAGTWEIVEEFGVSGLSFPNSVGGSQLANASSNETRTSVIVPTNSTQLTMALVPGNYIAECYVTIEQGAAGAVGVNCNLNYSGSFVELGGYIGSGGLSAATSFFPNGLVAAPGTVAYSVSQVNTFGTIFMMRQIFVATTAGTLAFAFAQNTSSATVVTLMGASVPGVLMATRF
jgi:hypothetical protein